MNASISLKDLERKAFRSTYQDGLWDIYQGGLIISFTAFAGGFDAPDGMPTLTRFILFIAGISLSYLIFWSGKKYITLPRLGRVTFGPMRQRRKRTLAIALAAIVGIQALVVVFSIALWQLPALRSWLGISAMPQTIETLIVAAVGALFVGPSLALIAYFNDFPRGYYVASVMAVCVFCLIWFGRSILLIAGGALVMLPGLFLFARFIIQHPLPMIETHNDR